MEIAPTVTLTLQIAAEEEKPLGIRGGRFRLSLALGAAKSFRLDGTSEAMRKRPLEASLSYQDDGDAAYIAWQGCADGPFTSNEVIERDGAYVVIDFTADGRIGGIELIGASTFLDMEALLSGPRR
jgi:uncharacterized protein YuzE